MNAIEFTHVCKAFTISSHRTDTFKEAVVNRLLGRYRPVRHRHVVLDDVSFAVPAGMTLGIIGRNGAGKSTILKLIARILRADSGSVRVAGSVSGLLEVGAGFHHELTGRENVYLYGAILGLPRRYLDRHFDAIVRFAELAEYMETPVKNYSSGMYMRLAFAVSVHVDPDILLIDEVLAVGDEAFQRKCLAKIDEFKAAGKTILFVSHDLVQVKRTAHQVLLLDAAGHAAMGEPAAMVNRYLASLVEAGASAGPAVEPHLAVPHPEVGRTGNRRAELTQVYFSDHSGRVTNRFAPGDDLVINLDCTVYPGGGGAALRVEVREGSGICLNAAESAASGIFLPATPGRVPVKVRLGRLPFPPGDYRMTLALVAPDGTVLDRRADHFAFTVAGGPAQEGAVHLNYEWVV